mmetsp:Transcript_29221/g.86520  ORF Transcript_29221/g.86520 Transcript_29221/m.86520 type:complete len:246 (-) Transcript_29221:1694-2431(-)
MHPTRRRESSSFFAPAFSAANAALSAQRHASKKADTDRTSSSPIPAHDFTYPDRNRIGSYTLRAAQSPPRREAERRRARHSSAGVSTRGDVSSAGAPPAPDPPPPDLAARRRTRPSSSDASSSLRRRSAADVAFAPPLFPSAKNDGGGERRSLRSSAEATRACPGSRTGIRSIARRRTPSAPGPSSFPVKGAAASSRRPRRSAQRSHTSARAVVALSTLPLLLPSPTQADRSEPAAPLASPVARR